MGLRIAKQDKKMEAAWQFNEEVMHHYKSQITKLELEQEDLRRVKGDLRKENEELRREMLRNINKETQLVADGAQSLQAALQFSCQVEDVSPTYVEQANQITAFEPDMEEIDLEELDEEDFAPPPAINSRKGNLQARPVSGGNDWSFGDISSSNKLQVRVEADMGCWKLNESKSFLGTGRFNQGTIQPWIRGAKRMSGAKRGLNMQEDNLHLGKGKRGRTLLAAPAISALRLF